MTSCSKTFKPASHVQCFRDWFKNLIIVTVPITRLSPIFSIRDPMSSELCDPHYEPMREIPTALVCQSFIQYTHKCVLETDMQHYLFTPGHDLDLRSIFNVDLSRSHYVTFAADRREKDVFVIIILLSLLHDKLLLENGFRPFRQF